VFGEAEVSSDTVQTLPPPITTANAGVLYIDRSELTQGLTPLTQAPQSPHNILYQIYKINGFLSSCIQRDDVK